MGKCWPLLTGVRKHSAAQLAGMGLCSHRLVSVSMLILSTTLLKGGVNVR